MSPLRMEGHDGQQTQCAALPRGEPSCAVRPSLRSCLDEEWGEVVRGVALCSSDQS